MTTMQPLYMFGLEVPAGDVAISGKTELPYGFRITMAAIDPSAEPEGESGAAPRATLKIIRQPLEYMDEDDEDDEDFDVDEMERMLAGDDEEDEDDDDDDDEFVNGGPSDPAKSKAAKIAAANKAVRDMLAQEDGIDVDSDDEPNGINGLAKSAKALGKMRASDMDEDDEDDDSEEGEIEEFVICTLDPSKNYQQPLDLTIGSEERVWFKVSGTHTIYLTGNYIHDPTEPLDYDEDDEDDMDEDYDLEPDSDELDDEEEDGLDDLADPRITELADDDEDVPALVTVSKKADKKGKNKRAAEEDVSMTLDDSITEAKKADANGEPKLSKKQQKKLKKNDGTATAAAAADSETPSSAKSDKKVSFAKNLEQGPTPTKASDDKSKPSAAAAAGSASSKLGVKVVQGVTIDDKKLGKGPAAKAGDRVSMRYIGKLQKDNAVFDKNTKGKPFAFKLGAGEVIRGWDIGIAGICAGGERRITIPAHLAYGRQAQAGIPANSALIFDVKALDIKGK